MNDVIDDLVDVFFFNIFFTGCETWIADAVSWHQVMNFQEKKVLVFLKPVPGTYHLKNGRLS